MKVFRAILIGILVWVLGVSIFMASYYLSFMEDLDQQANIVLSIVIVPLVWLGMFLYYKKNDKTHGYEIGEVMLLTSIALDALITVPLTVIPAGGSHYSFFTSFGFWFIAFEFIIVAVLYWRLMVRTKLDKQG